MFEVLVGVFAIAAIGFLAAAAALVRPFRPFGTRLSALRGVGLSFLCAVAAMFGAAILTDAPVRLDPGEDRSALNVDDQLVAVPVERDAAGRTRAERVAAEAAALAASRAAEAAEATPAALAAPGPAAAAPAPPPAAVGALMAAIDAAKWQAASRGLAELRGGGFDLGETLVAAERAARARVRGVPPSDPASARDGYLLLAALDPADATYPEKAESFAAAAERVETVDLVDRLDRREDEDGTIWLEHPDRPRALGDRSTVTLAIGRKGDGPPWLEMRTVYAGRSWLFVDQVKVSHGGTTDTLAFGWFERQQGAAAYEWRDERPDPGQVEILRRLARADDAILRFQGMQEGRDEPFPRADRAALADMLEAWDALRAD
ncbi:hypothetical protein [Albimonas pacifica]|uniref:Uncharacterized protein n=1 Tax=Albimonas pacifica TaxID=1114924 RepID=A0A1I3HQH3_9RHOB|nr:hypothetical protein [Albimonas pacifica]SFI37780.1 hypothetical protein SAMN05216258_106113 [Albimonas pacifica]